MRDIEFRALNFRTNKWLYSHGYYYDGTNYWFIIPSDNRAISFAEKHIVNISTIGQFTGLTDKNGKEIYEGDIVYQELCSPDDPAYGFYGNEGPVEFDSGSFMVNWGDISELLFGVHLYCEIRGNIHQNPELPWRKS